MEKLSLRTLELQEMEKIEGGSNCAGGTTQSVLQNGCWVIACFNPWVGIACGGYAIYCG